MACCLSLLLVLTALHVLVGMTAEGQCKSLVVFVRVAVGIVLATMLSVWRLPHAGRARRRRRRRRRQHSLSKLKGATQAAEGALLALSGRGSLYGKELLGAHAVLWSVLWGAAKMAVW